MWKYHIPKKNALRKPKAPFAWLDCRLLTAGFLQVMTLEDVALYLFLVLAADRYGVSFYRKEKICDVISLNFQQFEIARDRLVNMKLIAFEGYSVLSTNGFYQVLPVQEQAPDYAKKITEDIAKNLDECFRA